MNHKRNLLIIIVFAAVITFFGFLIDTDPAYPNFWHTVIEFSFLTFLCSAILGIFYTVVVFINKLPIKNINK